LANHLAQNGATTYDLGGIDPIKNKGVYNFKRGTNAADVEYLGEWDLCKPALLRTTINLLIARKNMS
jgi:lipid II:glycine glycyltransferase (peptidoglycan interpeptide bridge formation enzyme)